MRELREDTFSKNKNDDAHEHVERVLDIVGLFNIPGVTYDAVMLQVFPITLTGSAKRWVDRLSPRTVDFNDLLKKAFIQRYCKPSKTTKQLEDIHNFKQEGDETLYHACERYNDMLYKCPTHDINSHQKVNIFYNGLGTMNRQLMDSQGLIPGMTPAQALTAIQTMADHSQKWHDGSASRNIDSSSSNSEGITSIKFYQNTETNQEAHDKIIQGLETKVKTLTNKVEGRTNGGKFEECKAILTEDGSPLYTPFYYSPEEIKYLLAHLGFFDNERQENDKSGMKEALAALEIAHEIKEHHTKEALVHETMESLKKIKINRPLLKEIRQTDNNTKHMKDLVANKPRTEEDEEFKMNPRMPISLGIPLLATTHAKVLSTRKKSSMTLQLVVMWFTP
nr:hypothetical protein [Tanacetum cinerariifolium]